MKKFLLIVLLFPAITIGTANATYIGDTVQGQIVNPYGWEWSNTSATVGPGVEFTLVLLNVTFLADLTSDTLTLSYENTSDQPNVTLPPLGFTFNDLDWTDTSSTVIGFTESSNNFPSYVSMSTVFNLDNLLIDISLTNTNPGDLFSVTFQFDTSPISAPVPEPSTILLLGSGLAGLAWYGRKRKKA